MLRTCGSLAAGRLRQAARPAASLQQVRYLDIWELFNKEKLAKNREKLNDELRRGYFDDLRDLQKDGGKPFAASTELANPAVATAVLPVPVTDSTGVKTDLAEAGADRLRTLLVSANAATLLVVVFRANAQPMADSWTEAFDKALSSRPGAGIARLLVVESFAMGLPGVRNVILRGDGRPRPGRSLFLFSNPSDTYDLRQQLRITNRLTAYAYLLDARQRVRWQACGRAVPGEVASMLESAEQLLREGDRSRGGGGGGALGR